KPAEFTVEAKDAGNGPLRIIAQVCPASNNKCDADGVPVDVKVKSKGDNVYSCSYTPTSPIKHTLAVTWGGVSVPSSPFRVRPTETEGKTIITNTKETSTVSTNTLTKADALNTSTAKYKPVIIRTTSVNVGKGSHPHKVKVFGPGLERSGLKAHEPTHFTVDCTEAGEGDVSVGIKCEANVISDKEEDVDFDIIPNANDTITVKYIPPGAGRLTIKVLFTDQVRVQVGEDQEFAVGTRGAGGQGKLEVKITSPSGKSVPCVVEPQPGKGASLVKYIPKEEGAYVVEVVYDGNPVPGSPFSVEAMLPPDPSKVKAFGPGLKGGLVATPAEFSIDTKGAGTGGLGLTVEGPTEAKMECSDNGDGTCSVSYLPTEPGEYLINILFEDVHIPGSPFHADIQYPFDPTKVVASGSGLKRGKVGETSVLNVDCAKAGPGQLTLEAESDSGVKAKTEVLNNKDGTYTVTYVPLTAGMYTLLLKYGGKTVPNFPAKVNVDPAVDTSKVKVFGPGVAGEGVFREATTDFTVDARALTKVGGKHIKAHVKNPSGAATDCVISDNGDGTYNVEYTPFENGVHSVEVLYDETLVPKSPFQVGVAEGCDPSRVQAKGPGLEEALTDKPNKFSIVTRGAGIGGLGITIEGPSESKMSCKDNKDGSCNVEYTPYVPGLYDVNITYGGQHISGSPFKVPVKDVVDSSKVKISGPGVSSGVRAKIPQSFTVDCSKAGVAPLSVAVTGPKGTNIYMRLVHETTLPFFFLLGFFIYEFIYEFIYFSELSTGILFTLKYYHTTLYRLKHLIMYIFIYCYIFNLYRSSPMHWGLCPAGPGIGPTIGIGEEVGFAVNTKGAGKGKVSCIVVTPDGTEVEAEVIENVDGTFDIFYTAPKPGTYVIYVRFGGENIPRSPFKVMVTDGTYVPANSVNGTGYRPYDMVIPFTFRKGEITGEVHMPSGKTAQPEIIDNKDGTVTVKYAPTEAGLHEMHIKYNGTHIPGTADTIYDFQKLFSLFVVKDFSFTDNKRKSQVKLGSAADFSLDINETDLSLLTASIKAPSGRDEPCLLKRQPNNHIGISFIPREVGEHLVSIKKNGRHVPNSPISIMVVQSEIGDASRVKVFGQGLVEGSTFEMADFVVDTREAGYGGLALSIEGPSKVDIQTEDMEDGTCGVSYCPTEPGTYIVSIRFAEEHVPGSPFSVKVSGEGRIRESITRRQKAASVASVGSVCDLNLKIPGMKVPHINSMKTSSARLSSFRSKTGVRAAGPGLEKAETGVPAEFNVWTREAGAGGLSIALEGPSRAEISFEERKDGSCGVSYVAQEPGDYEVSIKFNDEHIPDSPYLVPVYAPVDDARRLTVTSLQESGLKVNQPASFAVRLNGAKGHMDAKVHSPSGALEECVVSELEQDKYAIRFIPRENGIHVIDVKFNGTHIPGSPFQVRVGEPGQSGDAGLVTAYGPGLERGTTGNQAEFIINNTKAGPGSLGVTIEGPSKVKMECQECPEGFKVHYTPMAPGNYVITIKYGGPNHITGSPFKAKVTGPRLVNVTNASEMSTLIVDPVSRASSVNSYSASPRAASDASKVLSRGPGLSKAFVGQKASFSVDCSKAGKNMLLVGVHGPLTPCEEILVKHMGNMQYNVSYVLKERGNYILAVKWGDEHIPGSPFQVTVP
uniref:Filamin B n=1 Tax=Cyprinus carpio TaxID=7962 RepID=A0A8C2H7H1_CYPCA